MTNDGGLRLATSRGAMLADPSILGNALETAGELLFDPTYWARRGELQPVSAGRGSAWFITTRSGQWALRHSRRGGWLARCAADRYVWSGEDRVRAFAEWRLLAALTARGLPVPRPVAARYRRQGIFYRCDLITQRILNAEPLSRRLQSAPLRPVEWRSVGAAVARLHRAGVDHVDLNAHNILIDAAGAVSLIDFDRCRVRAPGRWRAGNLARLRRSLDKIARALPAKRYAATDWADVLLGYAGPALQEP